MKLDRRSGQSHAEILDVPSDDNGLDVKEVDFAIRAPGRESVDGAGVGFAGVRVADSSGEEFEDVRPGLARFVNEQGGHRSKTVWDELTAASEFTEFWQMEVADVSL